jgi:hypothetical protein
MLLREFVVSDEYVPGNQVAYLSKYVGAVLPDVEQKLLKLAQSMVDLQSWYPDISQLGIRTVELITYRQGTKLVKHSDSGSMYTMTVLLGEAFKGGEFHIRNEDDSDWITFSSEAGDAFFFDSEIVHFVSEVD